MGLTMKERKALTRETAQRYRAATKKEKDAIVNEFTTVTGRNRKYALPILTTWCTFDYMWGKRLAVLIRMNRELLAEEEAFSIDEEVYDKLRRTSPATIDRILAPVQKKTLDQRA